MLPCGMEIDLSKKQSLLQTKDPQKKKIKSTKNKFLISTRTRYLLDLLTPSAYHRVSTISLSPLQPSTNVNS